MATIGLNYFIEGMAQTVWDSDVHVMNLGIDEYAVFEVGQAFINKFDVIAAKFFVGSNPETLYCVLACSRNHPVPQPKSSKDPFFLNLFKSLTLSFANRSIRYFLILSYIPL